MVLTAHDDSRPGPGPRWPPARRAPVTQAWAPTRGPTPTRRRRVRTPVGPRPRPDESSDWVFHIHRKSSIVCGVASQEQRKAETRQRLLDAAALLFAERGIEAVSIDTIAEAADRTSGAVYAHFGGKEGLLNALLENLVNESAAVMDAELSVAPTASPSDEQLAALWRTFASPPRARAPGGCCSSTSCGSTPAATSAARAHFAARFAEARRLVVDSIGAWPAEGRADLPGTPEQVAPLLRGPARRPRDAAPRRPRRRAPTRPRCSACGPSPACATATDRRRPATTVRHPQRHAAPDAKPPHTKHARTPPPHDDHEETVVTIDDIDLLADTWGERVPHDQFDLLRPRTRCTGTPSRTTPASGPSPATPTSSRSAATPRRSRPSWARTFIPTQDEEALAQMRLTILNMDPPEAQPLPPAGVSKGFTPRMIARARGADRASGPRPSSTTVCERGESEFVEEIAAQLPAADDLRDDRPGPRRLAPHVRARPTSSSALRRPRLPGHAGGRRRGRDGDLRATATPSPPTAGPTRATTS